MSSLDLAAIRAAHERIRPFIKRTPVLTGERLDTATGAALFLKCENFQEAGAFKSRGACNAVFSLTDAEAATGVVTHSSGNHAAALARAAQLRGITAHIVMPVGAARSKVRNVGHYGGWITFCEPNLTAREEACARVSRQTGATIVHPFDDLRVAAGQGTAALELLEDAADLDVILCPVGGGGLLCGTAVAAKALYPKIQIIGVEPELANDVQQSFRAGRRIAIPTPATIADGLRTNCTGEKNFPLIQQYVDDIVTVTEAGIVAAMRAVWEALHMVIEPSAAVPYAALMEQKIPVAGRRIGLLVTGGNADLDQLPWLNPEVEPGLRMG
ncbi:pyridoxal-phosphate dependent enzyme [Lacunisphaera limnophila]|uniref:pyridoxal-phosphate dependent enzyme n=1 Tax=Lacunisphaera limnophila TaxID=1838286 RepID=UPI0008598E12|nr:pyridoxal-phosphate dependent enzyme [Lacunisphaera limnophila]